MATCRPTGSATGFQWDRCGCATSYVARLYVPVTGDVLSEARQFPRVRLCSTVAFQPIEAGTRVVERIRIEAPRPLASVTARKAVEAHTVMLAGIRRRFEPAPN